MVKNIIAAALAAILAISLVQLSSSTPNGVTLTTVSNTTGSGAAAGMLNSTGGSITTIRLNGTTQNVHWKAFLGNVSGRLSLDDAAGMTVYDWTLTSQTGEVYATRKSETVIWDNISCANLTHIENENAALNHTNRDDNITATFPSKNHTLFYVGTASFTANSCYSIHTYVNDTAQDQLFQEMLLYDGSNSTNGNIVFGTTLEQDSYGFNNLTYDFQMIVPENGASSWASSTAYYFYMELN